MCLDLKRFSFVKTAKKDITVYKYLVERKKYKKGDEVKYMTPFQYYPILIGGIYTSKLERDGNFFIKSEVDKGLHSFGKLKDTKYNVEFEYNGVIVECIIPKGSKYYKGTFTTGKYESYASDTLKYVKIVEDENNK